MPDFIADPAWITAFFVGVASILGAVLVKGKAGAPKSSRTAPYQETARLQTDAEIREADASERIAASLEKIAGDADRISRHLELFIDRKTR